jgi:molecular chaperone DnaK (HSP70)
MAHTGGLGQAAALRLGIDFGTTRTVVAAVDDGRHPIAAFDHDGEFRDYIPLAEVADRVHTSRAPGCRREPAVAPRSRLLAGVDLVELDP